MRRVILGLAVALGASIAFAEPEVDALTWDVESAESQAHRLGEPTWFPESLTGAPKPESWQDKPSFGVAFSGGGIRSASASLGQLRALHQLEWFKEVKYISTVSGGTWLTLPFTFLPEAFSDAEFLGEYRTPETLTDQDLAPTEKYAMATVLSGAKASQHTVKAWFSLQGDETFASVLGELLLDRFQLNEMRSFAWSTKHVQRVIQRNSSCYEASGLHDLDAAPRFGCKDGRVPPSFLLPENFYVPRKDRPFHIVGTAVLAQRGFLQTSLLDDMKYPLEITPYYTGWGQRRIHTFPGTGATMPMGGVYVESFAYDGSKPRKISDTFDEKQGSQLYRVRLGSDHHNFLLRDVLAASGAAPQQRASAAGARNLGFPEFSHWSVDTGENQTRAVVRELAHTDGGHIDNVGLIPLLARGVENIIVFINTRQAFTEVGEHDEVSSRVLRPGMVEVSSRALYPGVVAYFTEEHRNHVIKDAKGCANKPACTPLGDLYEKLKAKRKAGLPLVHCDEYGIQARSDAHPRMPYSPKPTNICWVYLDAPQAWTTAVGRNQKLKQDLRLDLLLKRDDLKTFPHFPTFFPNGWEVIDYTPKQVSALAHLTSWTLCESAPEIAGQLKLPQLRGQCPKAPD